MYIQYTVEHIHMAIYQTVYTVILYVKCGMLQHLHMAIYQTVYTVILYVKCGMLQHLHMAIISDSVY